MPNEDPVEPSAVYAADGTQVTGPPDRVRSSVPAVQRTLVPAVVRALTAGPVLAASAFAVGAVAAVKAAEVAGRLMGPAGWQAVREAVERDPGGIPGSGVHISWTHVEIRWTPDR